MSDNGLKPRFVVDHLEDHSFLIVLVSHSGPGTCGLAFVDGTSERARTVTWFARPGSGIVVTDQIHVDLLDLFWLQLPERDVAKVWSSV